MQVQERRSASRYRSNAKGYAVLNGVDLDLKTHDLSSNGALVEFTPRYSIREGSKLHIHLDTGYVGSAIVCRAISDEGQALFALRFEEYQHEAVAMA